MEKRKSSPPSFFHRVYSVWYRHIRVYNKHLISNGFPPFLEPLFFIAGIGLGLGNYVGLIGDTPYLSFLAAGMLAPPAMFTAAFECTFGTFIRLEFDKAYDGMVSSSLTVSDLFIGEMLFAGTKGLFFSFAVLTIFMIFGLIPSKMGLLTPLIGFLSGLMFAALALFVTSFVKTINHFNFFLTGCLTPMFFFSGVIFPITNLPYPVQIGSEIFPLTHSTRIIRACCLDALHWSLLWDLLYIIVFTIIIGWLAISRLRKRLIQ
ncbi:MAG: ABC transporter permease [Proteobacteria bacterium]|nr:ABC transporter permease [Pseudomonadota bacterium]